MPRVAVTALAYVGMGANFNTLSSVLPDGSLCWMQYVVFLQLLICMEGTAAHLAIFAMADGASPDLVKRLNTTMLFWIPGAYLGSFLVATVAVSLGQLIGVIITVILASLPPLAVLVHGSPSPADASVIVPSQSMVTNGSQANEAERAQELESLDPLSSEDTKSGGIGSDGMARLDEMDFNSLFKRYDLDDSGFIDSREELTQLTMAVIYKMKLDQDFLGGNMIQAVDLKVNLAFQQASAEGILWSELQAKEWLNREFLSGQ